MRVQRREKTGAAGTQDQDIGLQLPHRQGANS
jgi:hypothetical protein